MARRRRRRQKAAPQLERAIQNARGALDDLERAAREARGLTLEHRGYEAGYRDGTLELQRSQMALAGARHDLAMQAQRIREMQAGQGAQTGHDQQSYQRGYQDGIAARPQNGADEVSIREAMKADMLERCRVISESNPQMAPGVNAVRHMISKL